MVPLRTLKNIQRRLAWPLRKDDTNCFKGTTQVFFSFAFRAPALFLSPVGPPRLRRARASGAAVPKSSGNAVPAACANRPTPWRPKGVPRGPVARSAVTSDQQSRPRCEARRQTRNNSRGKETPGHSERAHVQSTTRRAGAPSSTPPEGDTVTWTFLRVALGLALSASTMEGSTGATRPEGCLTCRTPKNTATRTMRPPTTPTTA